MQSVAGCHRRGAESGSRDAIGKYLYFCAKEQETGMLDFSKTLEEHQRKVAAYAESWQKYDEARGIQ